VEGMEEGMEAAGRLLTHRLMQAAMIAIQPKNPEMIEAIDLILGSFFRINPVIYAFDANTKRLCQWSCR